MSTPMFQRIANALSGGRRDLLSCSADLVYSERALGELCSDVIDCMDLVPRPRDKTGPVSPAAGQWVSGSFDPLNNLFTRRVLKASTAKEVQATLEARTARYGEFTGVAEIGQELKDVMRARSNWESLSYDKKEALETIAQKIARILNGDPSYHDSWHDIAGYAELVANTLKGDKS